MGWPAAAAVILKKVSNDMQQKILALDLGGTFIKAGLFDRQGALLEKSETPSNAKKGAQAMLAAAYAAAERFGPFDAVGVSSNGQIDPNGHVIYANDNVPGLTGMPLKEIFQARFRVPVAVESDVHAAAMGEMHFGAAQGFRDFVCLTYGTGVGGALMLDGRLYRGANFVAGEIGHLITHPNGLPCACGGRGCYEQYASVSALVEAARAIHAEYTSGKRIFAAMAEDAALRPVVDAWTDEIVYGLVGIAHIFNPRLMVLGGGIMNERGLLEQIRRRMLEQIMPSYRNMEIRAAQLKNMAGVYGAMAAAREELQPAEVDAANKVMV